MWKQHLPEYLIEAWGLGSFLFLVGIFATIFYTDIFSIPQLIPNPLGRDIIMGIIVGFISNLIIYSPWGKRSGAHLNPAVTMTFFRLGKLTSIDAMGYCLFQFVGGTIGIFLSGLVMGKFFVSPAPIGLNHIVTAPGRAGWIGALITEIIIAFLMMLMVLTVSNNRRIGHLTGVFASILVSIFVIFASPYSGFSMNPARSFASAFWANSWEFYWILGLTIVGCIWR
jgi:aquaporin Z